MVYEGTVTITKIAKNVLKIYAADFDADTEETKINLSTYLMEGAQDFTMHVIRTAGATDVVSVNLQASNEGTTFGTVLTETGVNYQGFDSVEDKSCHSIKILVSTVGAGNTLDVYVYATIN